MNGVSDQRLALAAHTTLARHQNDMSAPASPVERPFTETYLLAYSDEHVFYEIDMFLWLAQVCGGGAKIGAGYHGDATRLSNVLIEAFVVHLRNLIDFLYIDAPQKTDVVAADFCAAGTWKAARPPLSSVLDKARKRAHKEIAHLTTNRLTGSPPAKEWEFVALATEIQSVLRVFAKTAMPSWLSERARSVIG